MKNTLSQLPGYAKGDLKRIVWLILKGLPQTEMIILYGSYAKGTYVKYDERYEFGILTTFMSDYDILVVTSGIDSNKASYILSDIDTKYYKRPDNQVPPEFINEDIEKLNSDLSEGRYFYTEVKRDGIMLYNSRRYKLARARKLTYSEIAGQAQEYFDQKFNWADGFLKCLDADRAGKDHRITAYMLQQACENFFFTLRLVHTLKNSKQHKLSELLKETRRYSPELKNVFPRNTKEERRLFDLLQAAYIEGRYNSKFKVTREDIDALLPKMELLRDITEKTCKAKIESYRLLEKQPAHETTSVPG